MNEKLNKENAYPLFISCANFLRLAALCLLLASLVLPKQALAARPSSNSSNSILYLGAGEKNATQTKAKYKIKTDSILFKDDSGLVRGVVSFQYPQFTGTSTAIKKVNKKIKQMSQEFLESENAKSIEECTALAIETNHFYDENEQYYWTTSCNVSYNKNGIVSFNMMEQWYAGGVYNLFEYGLNYNLKTGKKLSINDVISGNAREKILKAAKKYCGSDTNAYEIIKNTKSYKFYLEKGKVYICFGSYELDHGSAWDKFYVAGKYK